MTRHLAALDGMRGIAALSVLLFHLGHWLDNPWLAANSGLSVDLFFCLSGYVLPLAYWPRRDGLSNAEFFRVRAIRLMPLIVLGALVSLGYAVLKVHVQHLTVPPTTMLVAGAGALFNLPTFGAPHDIGGPMVFPLNGPQYTLFLEFVANAAWWALRKHDHRRLTVGIILASLICLYAFGLGGDEVQNFWLGFPRVAFSFSIGLGLYFLRGRYSPRGVVNAAAFGVTVLITLAVFYWPSVLPSALQVSWVVLVAPLLVLSGTRLALGGLVSRAALFLGELSYPIYALHYPIFCWVNGLYRSKFGAQNVAVEAPLAFATVVVGAFLALRFFDEPVRRWLARRRTAGPTPGGQKSRLGAHSTPVDGAEGAAEPLAVD